MKLLASASSALLLVGSILMTASAQPPSAPAPPTSSSPGQTVTIRANIRGFSAGPDGAPRTLFLSNGDAVELGPRFGNLAAGELRKGLRIQVTGSSANVANQRIIDASMLRVGSQTYAATPAGAALPPAQPGAVPVIGAPPPLRIAGATPPAPPAPGAGVPPPLRNGRAAAPPTPSSPPPPPCGDPAALGTAGTGAPRPQSPPAVGGAPMPQSPDRAGVPPPPPVSPASQP